MVARGFGYVLQVASVAAYQPAPTFAVYAAAKAFVVHFSEALAYELRHSNVRVSVLSPGTTDTEFLERAGMRPNLYLRLSMMSSRSVARSGLRALLSGRPARVAGLLNATQVFFVRFLPRRVAAALAGLFIRQH